MVRQLTKPRPRGWKAVLAAFVAAGAVAWQIMACVESPMSFSPTGDLAFTVTDPYGGEEFGQADANTFRVMVLTQEQELREIERSNTHVLTAPSYSPDGKRIAYLRIQALTPEDVAQIEDRIGENGDTPEHTEQPNEPNKWVAIGPENARLGDWETLQGVLFEQTRFLSEFLGRGGGLVAARLVVRDAASGAITTEIPLQLPILGGDEYHRAYLSAQPIFSPDGKRVYLSANRFALAINLAGGETTLLAGNAETLALSPDGRTLAAHLQLFADDEFRGKPVLALIATDGSRVAYLDPPHRPAMWGMAWTGDGRLLVLGEADDAQLALAVFERHGTLISSGVLDFGEAGPDGEHLLKLGLSPDGNYMTIVTSEGISFLSADGVLLGGREHNRDDLMIYDAPLYTPDSRQVALKLIESGEEESEEEWSRTSAVVFFTPGGQELFRVPIPPLPKEDHEAPPAAATEEVPQ